MSFGILATVPLRGKINALGRIPFSMAQVFRRDGLELLAHMLLEEFMRVKGLQEIALTSRVEGTPPVAILSVRLTPAESDECQLIDDSDVNSVFPGELFGTGAYTLTASHRIVKRVLSGEVLLDEYFALIVQLSHEMYCHFNCSQDRDE